MDAEKDLQKKMERVIKKAKKAAENTRTRLKKKHSDKILHIKKLYMKESYVVPDDISEFKIEGIGLGDSLLIQLPLGFLYAALPR